MIDNLDEMPVQEAFYRRCDELGHSKEQAKSLWDNCSDKIFDGLWNELESSMSNVIEDLTED